MERNEILHYKQLFDKALKDSCLPFWLNNAPDGINGGIYTCLDRRGKIYSTDKSVWMQGRCGWLFAYLCNVYGIREEWIKLSESCIGFIDKYCIDKNDGRLYFTVTEDGRPLRKRRYFFSEAFAIIAHAEYALASGNAGALEWAKTYYDFVCGIYQDRGLDPYKIAPKLYAETRAVRSLAEPMILLNVTSVMRRCDPENRGKYDKASREFINDILTYFYKEDQGMLLETVGMQGEFLDFCTAGRVINPGHSIEASWFMLSEAEYFGDEALAKKAENIFNFSLRRGYDRAYGGILYFVDALSCPPETCEHDMKLWWVHNEAIIASLMLYRKTGKEAYAKWFKTLVDYAFNTFADREFGEWYGYARRDGKLTEPPCKGSTFKGPFHLPRMLMIGERILTDMLNERQEEEIS